MKVETPVPCLRIYDDWYPECDKFLENVIEAASKEYSICPWRRSTIGDDNREHDFRSSVECFPEIALATSDSDFAELSRSMEHFKLRVTELVHDYDNSYDLQLTRDSQYTVIKYANKAEYRAHWDHSKDNQRVLSVVVFLNDDFEGGELEFPHFDYKVTPKQGKVCVFPSNFPYLHIAHPVESGTKYTAVNWYM